MPSASRTNTQDKILQTLQDFPDKTWTSRTLSDHLGITKTTILKHLHVLRAEDKIYFEDITATNVIKLKTKEVVK